MKRVAYFAHTAEVSGPNNSLRRLLGELDRHEFAPVIFFPNAGPVADELASAGETCRIVPAASLQHSVAKYPSFAFDLFKASRQLVTHLNADNIALVHVNTCVTPQPAIAASFAGVPVVCHVRESLRRTRINNLYFALVLRLAHRVIAVSQAVREDVLRRTTVSPERVEVIYNGLNLSDFDRRCQASVDEPIPRTPAGAVVIALPAFFLAHKGHEVLLAAARRLVHEYHLDVVVWLIGHEAPEDGDHFTQQLITSCNAYGIGDRVRFLGFRRDVPALVSAADIVCVPSTYPDPLPNAVLEGMAASKPVVASATGGIPELLGDGEAGMLVAPGSNEALASALARVIRDPECRERFGRAGRARVEAQFTSQRHAERVQEVYRSLFDSAGVTPIPNPRRAGLAV